jgi:hypothetical protein
MLMKFLAAAGLFVGLGLALWALVVFAGDRRPAGGCGCGCDCMKPCDRSKEDDTSRDA